MRRRPTAPRTWRLYLDGQLEATHAEVNQTPRADTTQEAGLGTMIQTSGPGNTGRFRGVLDESRVWDSARTGARSSLPECGAHTGRRTSSRAGRTRRGRVPRRRRRRTRSRTGRRRHRARDARARLDLRRTGGPLSPPTAPTGLDAEPGDGTVTLTWGESPDADVIGYNVYRSSDERRFRADPPLQRRHRLDHVNGRERTPRLSRASRTASPTASR